MLYVTAILFACEKNTAPHPPGLDIKKELFHFSSNMSESDTVYIKAYLSMCMWRHTEWNMLIKKDHRIFLQSFVEVDDDTFNNTRLGWVEYTVNSSDTLNFEDLFNHLSRVRKGPGSPHRTCEIASTTDTVGFDTYTMAQLDEFIHYYLLIKGRLYPRSLLYHFEPDTIGMFAPIEISIY